MKGEFIKRKLAIAGYKHIDDELAYKIGIKRKTLESLLDSEDVKTSVLEMIQNNLHLSPLFFFSEEKESKSILGQIIVNTDPLVLRESQYELDLSLGENQALKYLVIVSISLSDKYGRHKDIYTPDTYQQFLVDDKSKIGVIYFMFLDEKNCAVRYIDENGRVHKQFIGNDGLRITLEPSSENGKYILQLFKNTEEIKSAIVSFNSFVNSFQDIWYAYEYEENNTDSSGSIRQKNLDEILPNKNIINRTEYDANLVK